MEGRECHLELLRKGEGSANVVQEGDSADEDGSDIKTRMRKRRGSASF